MSELRDRESAAFGPWNPGIASELPRALLPLSTILRPENVFTGAAQALELREFSGLPLEEVVAFRPHRLAVHELLIRVTADLSVPDGPRQEDLGINFRQIADTLFAKHVRPHMARIEDKYDQLRGELAALIAEELHAAFSGPPPGPSATAAPRFWALLGLGRSRRTPTAADDRWRGEELAFKRWAAAAERDPSELKRAAFQALVRLASSFRIKHPRMRLDIDIGTHLATTLACNTWASELIGRLIDPMVREGTRLEGYRLLPRQERPVVMNTKGASASGKSTMRPLQKRLAGEIGVDWDDFALISPDIWRKYLLDYESLGAAYKYAGSFTGLEMEVIHHKLDRYMASKAERGEMSHLLIDRFRFDSFAPDSDEAGSNLLTRFGHLVYLFFMITPPHATVERAWQRGLQVGRYKAVDDLLAHNVEAYSGMPELFFTWALRENKRVHYEFLDNSVSLGERPRTIAFGWNGEMNILDVKCMLDIDRYRKINIDAMSAAAVYPDTSGMAPENNVGFIAQCARRLPALNFVERGSGLIYLRIERNRPTWAKRDALARALEDSETRAGIGAVAPAILDGLRPLPEPPQHCSATLDGRRYHTLGVWGPGADRRS